MDIEAENGDGATACAVAQSEPGPLRQIAPNATLDEPMHGMVGEFLIVTRLPASRPAYKFCRKILKRAARAIHESFNNLKKETL
jgi:hypothetical protein